METTISKQQSINASSKSEAHAKPLSKFWEMVEFNRYGAIAMMLIVIGCLGGFAASYAAGANVYKIALIVFPTILSLAFILAVMPMRLIVWVSTIAVLLDIALLIAG
ncbi:MAG: hypothetical protein KBG47_02420 [Bacteroidia bacterium]|jgi:hypothetical protein|nr:hypothetical protein [Sphingobacteriaceae bacterium]MBK7309920.1 hypothetical protein [Sphingobacteriaceae bacterium]MBK7818143.1 hypothetical protein [Sphingobacteriaceae bacterium]MBP9068334.1 hypothetical protein [Bacteroidia bacterium]